MLIHLLSDVVRNPDLASALERDPEGFLRAQYPELAETKKGLLLSGNLAGVRGAVAKEVDESVGGVHSVYSDATSTFTVSPRQGAVDRPLSLTLTATARVGALPDLRTWTATFRTGECAVQARSRVGSQSADGVEAVLQLEVEFAARGVYRIVLTSPGPVVAPIVVSDEFTVV